MTAAGLIALGYALIIFLWWSPGPKRGPHTLMVHEGSTVATVARQLDREGAIPGNALTFRAMARLFGPHDPIQAGEFEIPNGMSAARILELLEHGKPVLRLVTVPEGMPSIEVQAKLAAIPYLTGPSPLAPDGSLLPDTYGYQRGEARAAIIQRMQQAMTSFINSVWPQKKGDCPISSKQDALTLASIVEKETAKPAERPLVAGVYCNRLKIGMALDADPTVIYPITRGKPLGRRIKESELHSTDPYNTYTHPGLPPGPITNPGRASILAVLNPAQTKALYFVADGTGGHVFADTLAEQNANVQKWYAIRRQRGQM
jgi:UPF0755 protein